MCASNYVCRGFRALRLTGCAPNLDLVLEGIVDSFYGRPLPKVTVFKTRDRRPREVRKEELRKLGEEYKYLYGEDGQARLREDLAALDERKSHRQTVCSNSNCRRTQDEGEKFMRCGKCWTLTQRTIMYCGKYVQLPHTPLL